MEWSASKFFQIAFPYFSKTGKGLPLVFRLEAHALAIYFAIPDRSTEEWIT